MKIESFRRKIASFGEKDPFSVPSAFQGKLNLKQNGKVEKEGKIALEQGRKVHFYPQKINSNSKTLNLMF